METKISSEDWEQIEKIIPDQVPELRKKLKEKHNIIVPAHCNDLIARCIRMKDGKLDNALKLLKQFHTTTRDFHEWNAIFRPTSGIDEYNAGLLMPISQRDPHGTVILIGRVGMWDPDKMTFDHIMAGAWMLLNYVTGISKDAQRNGIVTIWDFTDYSMKQVFATDKWRVLHIIRIIQNGLAGRIKEFHVINHSKIFSVLYSTIIKPFMKDKMKKRITFHDKLETLHARFDKNGLPAFAGGGQTIDECMDWNLMKEFLGQDQYFIDMMNDGFPRY